MIINRQVVKYYLLDVIDDLPIGGHAYGTTWYVYNYLHKWNDRRMARN
jgi:hypothetical protein